MADSTLARTGATPPDAGKGHGTAALGPSDSSDNGSDVRGGPGLRGADGIGLAPVTSSGPERASAEGAGADPGDGAAVDLDTTLDERRSDPRDVERGDAARR